MFLSPIQTYSQAKEANFTEISVCASCHCVFMLNGRGGKRICQASLQRWTLENKINIFRWLSIIAMYAMKALYIQHLNLKPYTNTCVSFNFIGFCFCFNSFFFRFCAPLYRFSFRKLHYCRVIIALINFHKVAMAKGTRSE